jgi:streptogramin lyase
MLYLFLSACTPTETPSDKAADTAADTADDTGASGGIQVTAAYDGLTAGRDAAPSPDGASVYFTTGDDVQAGTLDGLAAATTVATFATPVGLVPSADGATLYVADTTGLSSVTLSSGAIQGLDLGGLVANGVDDVVLDGVEWVYFTAIDPMEGTPAVGRVRPDTGDVETIVYGGQLSLPSGIVVGSDGTIWVADLAAGPDSSGALVRIVDGVATLVADGFVAGHPAGVGMPSDESLVLVSAVSDAGHSEVFIYAVGDGSVSTYDDVIGENVGSGGLHRADAQVDGHDVFAWCGVTSGGTSSVYQVRF